MTYEAYFGISGAPFRLGPDPSFRYESRGHRDALAQLRKGIHEGQGIVVVSGEIGAGKTLLAGTLVEVLARDRFSVAQLVTTRLDATDLLRAIVTAFDASCVDAPEAELSATLQVVLANKSRRGRKPLLLIDEAQNLSDDGFALLQMLAVPRPPAPGSLQMCLVGQPELRVRIASGQCLDLRQYVGVSCHLEALDPLETRAYIEHRLQTVGWVASPAFCAGAFDEIFRRTSGVPRRINVLCNRLMLTLFLEGKAEIDVATVVKAATDLRAEIGEPVALRPEPVVSGRVVGGQDASESLAGAPSVVPHRETLPAGKGLSRAVAGRGPLLCVVVGHGDHVKAAPLMRAFARRQDLPGATLVRVFGNDALALNLGLFEDRSAGDLAECLHTRTGSIAEQIAEVMPRFESVIDRRRPSAVVIIDGSETALACGRVARRKGVPVVRVGGGLRSHDGQAVDEIVRVESDHLSDLVYTSEPEADGNLLNEGVAPERIVCAGNVLIDSVQLSLRTRRVSMRGLRLPGTPREFLPGEHDFGLVVLDRPANLEQRQLLGDLTSILRAVSRDIPLVWPMHSRGRLRLKQSGVEPWVVSERIICMAMPGFAGLIDLMSSATCLLTDSWDMQEVATALGVPCLTLGPDDARSITIPVGSNTRVGSKGTLATRIVWEILYNGGKKGSVPALWDGRASERVALHLSQWLAARQLGVFGNVPGVRATR